MTLVHSQLRGLTLGGPLPRGSGQDTGHAFPHLEAVCWQWTEMRPSLRLGRQVHWVPCLMCWWKLSSASILPSYSSSTPRPLQSLGLGAGPLLPRPGREPHRIQGSRFSSVPLPTSWSSNVLCKPAGLPCWVPPRIHPSPHLGTELPCFSILRTRTLRHLASGPLGPKGTGCGRHTCKHPPGYKHAHTC